MPTPQEARVLLDRYRAGTCSDTERELVEQWYDALDKPVVMPDNEAERARLIAQSYSDLSQKMHELPVPRPVPKRTQWQVWGTSVAAAVVLLAGIGWYEWSMKTTRSLLPDDVVSEMVNEVIIRNMKLEPIMVRLPDGSSVTLQAKSQLRYPRQFATTHRTVSLVGEGFFDVQKNPAQPFFVNANRLVTRVLGTSFWVRAFPRWPTAEVTVVSGRVAVYAGKTMGQRPATILIPNQRATFYVIDDQLVTSLAHTPVPLKPETQQDVLVDDAPVADVLDQLSTLYGVPISYDKAVLANCTVTAHLTDQPLFTKLDQICASIGASYQRIGTCIVVESSGCE